MNPPNPRLKQLLKTARQPQWVAAFLSLGFHIVLFAAGPSFSSLSLAALGGSESNGEDRQVPLLELTPEEQSRLPDFSTPDYSLFPGGDDELFSLFPPSGDSLPLNPQPGLGAAPSLPQPRLPNGLSGSISPFPGLGRSSSIVIPPRRATSTPVMPGSGPSRPSPSSDNANATPPEETPEETAAADTDDTAGRAADLMPEADNGSPSGGDAPETAALNPEAAAAERASELLARVEYSDDQTSSDDVESAKATWLQEVKEELGDDIAEAPEPITLQVPYSGRLCLSPEPADGLLGLVGLPDDDGNGLKLWTSVLKSTGYPFLNEAAQQALSGLEQSAPETQGTDEDTTIVPNTLYQVVLEVEYDSQTCISREALLRSRTTDGNATDSNTADSAVKTPDE